MPLLVGELLTVPLTLLLHVGLGLPDAVLDGVGLSVVDAVALSLLLVVLLEPCVATAVI